MKSSWKKQRQATKNRQIKNIRIEKWWLGSKSWFNVESVAKNCRDCGQIMGYFEEPDDDNYICYHCSPPF